MEQRKNTTRFLEFEFLTALAMLGLPLVHTMEAALYENLATESLAAFSKGVFVLDIFGPSVFMICMGFGIGGGKVSVESTRRTGIQFLLLNFVLNLLRWFLPGLIEAAAIGTDPYVDFYYCFESDIYFFVGLFFIFYSFFMKLKHASFWLLLISLLTLTVNQLFVPYRGEMITDPILNGIVGNFIYVNVDSCFPLFSWAIFPTVGILLGEVLKRNTEEFRRQFMWKMTAFSATFFAVFAFFLHSYGIDVMRVLVSENNDYITDLPNVLLLLSIAGVLIGGAYYLCRAIRDTRFMAFMQKLSAFIVPFYMLQWIIISWIFYALVIFRMEEGSFGFAPYFVIAISVLVFCTYVSTRHGMKLMRLITKIICPIRKRRKRGKGNA